MKKLISTILIISFMVSLAACGNRGTPKPNNQLDNPGQVFSEYIIKVSNSKENLSNGTDIIGDDATNLVKIIDLGTNNWLNDYVDSVTSCYILIEYQTEKISCRYCIDGVIEDLDKQRALKLSETNKDIMNNILSKYIDFL